MKSRKSTSIVLLSFSPLVIFLIISHLPISKPHNAINTRHNLEIIIGGGSSSPPPDPETPECPPPPPPPPPEDCPPPPHPSPPPPPPPRHPPQPPSPSPSPPKSTPNPPKSKPQKPKPKPKPSPNPNPQSLPIEILRAQKVIERFRRTVKTDPFNVTGTWNGRLCFDKTKYKGFICDTTITDNKLRVALVNFNGFRLAGKKLGNGMFDRLALNNFLDGLTDIIVFHSNSNFFGAGQVPAAINLISSLFELDLSNNKLSGVFPPQILTATNLTFLDLRFNNLVGKVPPEAFKLDLDVLYLNNNQFEGAIPDALGKTPSLYVTLANNKFTGAIPASIGQASNTLLEILLLGNKLSGCLPYEIGFLKKTTLFDASNNVITGPIPLSFGCLKSIQYLNISFNEIYGTVPESLCMIGGLQKLTLNSNYITQVGPRCRKLIARKVLDVSMNCILDLPKQRSKEECAHFFSKQRSCPNPKNMIKVPCKIEYSSADQTEDDDNDDVVERKMMELPRTYAALELHV